MNLFIIGNGFDLAHGLETSYWNFRQYLKDADWSYLQSLEEMYGFFTESSEDSLKEYLWRDFETNLAYIDEISIIEQGENIDLGLEGGDFGIEDTLNDYWEQQYSFIKRLNDFTMRWIEQVDIDTSMRADIINQDENNLFITFNYTLLLEQIYGINKANILHVHGSIDEEDESPIIGHGAKEKIMQMREIAEEAANKVLDEKRCSIYKAVEKYYQRTLKDVDLFIRKNEYFFRGLSNVSSIHIIGHSLGGVDMPYFEKICNNVSEDTIWHIYYYSEDSRMYYRDKIVSMGVNEDNIRLLNSNSLFSQLTD